MPGVAYKYLISLGRFGRFFGRFEGFGAFGMIEKRGRSKGMGGLQRFKGLGCLAGLECLRRLEVLGRSGSLGRFEMFGMIGGLAC